METPALESSAMPPKFLEHAAFDVGLEVDQPCKFQLCQKVSSNHGLKTLK